MNFQGKTAVITGGRGGIGLAIAHKLADRGMDVYSVDRGNQPEYPHLTALEADITDRAQIHAALQRIPGTIDLLINNAGLMRRGTILESSEEDFDALFDVHVKGSWMTFCEAHPKLADDARIVQMASRHANSLPANPGLYGLSKFACMGLARVMQQTCPNLTVKILNPGPIDTPLARTDVPDAEMKEKEKMMRSPEELAELVMQLLDSDASQLTYQESRKDYVLE